MRSKGEDIISAMVFTDQILQIGQNQKKTNMIIMITDWSMYLLKNGSFELMYYVKIEYLVRIINLVTDTNVFALNFAGKEIKNKQGTQAFLFDSARRAELILFIQTVCANNPNRKAPPVVKRTESMNITNTAP